MTFKSILYRFVLDDCTPADRPPQYFRDLNLDQVVDFMVRRYEHYDLKPFFYSKLNSVEEVAYRQEIFRDLERADVLECVKDFADGMQVTRDRLGHATSFHYECQRKRWLLDAADVYCRTVRTLGTRLREVPIVSCGLTELRGFVESYLASDRFLTLERDVARSLKALADVRYDVLIKGNRVTVRRFADQPDYGEEVLSTFRRFRQGDDKAYDFPLRDHPQMNHVEAQIFDIVREMQPAPFALLDAFVAGHRDFADGTLTLFDREVHFYVAYLETLRELSRPGLHWCYPVVSGKGSLFDVAGFYDAALAIAFGSDRSVVCNDLCLKGERLLVVTGPNQGGKTTFARAIGQAHHLAALGGLVPGERATVSLVDSILTHFERGENVEDRRGKLLDDLIRSREIMKTATRRSLIVLNEIFGSTALEDAVKIGRQLFPKIEEIGCLCVCVTFLDELAAYGDHTLSLVASVDPEDAMLRTFKIERRRADGRSYAMSVARRYGLTYALVRERLRA